MTKSIETQHVLINLAFAVADALENPSTPASLMDGLREVASSLINELNGGNAALELRALAVHIQAYPEPEKSILGDQGAIFSGSDANLTALAKASVTSGVI